MPYQIDIFWICITITYNQANDITNDDITNDKINKHAARNVKCPHVITFKIDLFSCLSFLFPFSLSLGDGPM